MQSWSRFNVPAFTVPRRFSIHRLPMLANVTRPASRLVTLDASARRSASKRRARGLFAVFRRFLICLPWCLNRA